MDTLTVARDCYRAIIRRIGIFFLVFLILFGVIAWNEWRRPPSYLAEASLLVRPGREYLYASEMTDVRGKGKYYAREDMISTEIEILTSLDVAEAAIRKIGRSKIYPDIAPPGATNANVIAAAVKEYREKLNVRGSDQSAIIRVSFEHTDPSIAALVVNQHVDCFKDRQLSILGASQSISFLADQVAACKQRLEESQEAFDTYRLLGISRSMSFLADQITTYERQLEKSEEAFDSYRLEYALFSPEEQRKLLLTQRVGLDGQLKSLDNQAAEMQKRLTNTEQEAIQSKRAALLAQLRQMDAVLRTLNAHEKKLRNLQREMVTSEEMYRTYARKLEEFRISEALDLQKLTNMSVLVEHALVSPEDQKRLVLSQKVGLEGQLKSLDNQTVEMQKRLSKAGQDANQSKRGGIHEQLRQMDELTRPSSEHEKTLRDLLREMATSEEMYRTYARRLEEARISEEMDAQRLTNISILQAATAPVSPSGVPLRIKLGVAAVMGVMAGMAAALLADFALGKRRERA